MRDGQFEWDDEKARKNLAVHRVSFQTATAVFADINALVEADDEASEERWQTIGLASSQMLFVVWTERHGDVIRIISARRATRHEEDRYFRQAHPEG
jgi:uncharacterized DUF497 family protein